MRYKNYYAGASKKFIGLGVMFEIDPPYTNVRRAWMFELRLGWFKFWYIKEKKSRAKSAPKPVGMLCEGGYVSSNTNGII